MEVKDEQIYLEIFKNWHPTLGIRKIQNGKIKHEISTFMIRSKLIQVS